MASTKWLHHRLWCGRLPLFHLLADDELQAELKLSLLHFGSNEFAELRTEIRLKLTETPLIHQTRRSASTYTQVLELLTKYLPYLLALRQFINTDHYEYQQQHQDESTQVVIDQLAIFSPLFYGFSSMSLSSDRLVGREQRIQYTLAIDLTLTLLAMAQMHALYAEAHVEQAVKLQSGNLLQIAEGSWQDAHQLFNRAARIAKNALGQFSNSSDPQQLLGSILKFLSGITVKAQVLGHMCALHRVSARVYFLILMDESTERLARAVSAYARHARILARAAAEQLAELPENEFTRQLLWLLKTYETRWRAIHYSCEQTVFQLDFNPDIAVHFSEATLRLRLAPLPSYSHRHDTFFTRIAQELQLVHQGHLNDTMDEKKALIAACQQKFGTSWTGIEDLSKEDKDELLRIRELSLDLDSTVSCCGCDVDEQSPTRDQDCEGELYEANQQMITELRQNIKASVNKAVERAANGESICASEASQLGNVDTGSEDRKRNKMMGCDLPAEVRDTVTGMMTLGESPRSPRSSSPARSRFGGVRGSNLGEAETDSEEAVRSFTGKSPAPSSVAQLDVTALNKRPSSAQLPAKSTSHVNPQKDTGWVKMTVGGKTLHFENASSLSYGGGSLPSGGGPSQLNHSPGKRRNAVPMAIADEDTVDTGGRMRFSALDQYGRLKARPASSPSYLSTKKDKSSTTRTHDEHPHGHKTQMWAPTRGQCALCERRYMRNHLTGVVVMKRIFDLRRTWGMIIQDSKKFYAASALYAKAQVCLMCQEILLHEDERSLQAFESEPPQKSTATDLTKQQQQQEQSLDEIGRMIYDSIMHKWSQQPPQDEGHLEDVALNKRARQSSTIFGMDARNAVQPDAIRCAHTREELQPWWEVDLANYHVIHSVKIWLREEISHLYNGNGIASGDTTADGRAGVQRKTLLRPMHPMHPPLRHLGMFPLHISVSMKTGVGRDLDDILSSCVSSQCVEEKAMPPIVWHAPPNSRGRFVRIQAEGQAILHIEKVHVFIASATQQQQKLHDSKVRKESLRQQLKKAAFRASIVVNPANKRGDLTVSAPEHFHHGAIPAHQSHAKSRSSNLSTPSSRQPTPGSLATAAAQVHPHSLVSTFLEPEQAEKKRISRLYSRFKSLLDARSKYMMDELDHERDSEDD